MLLYTDRISGGRQLTLKDYFIGTGGWGYFRVPGLNPLLAYSKAFNFVEVNNSFYHVPSVEAAKKWRRIVPKDFMFSLRVHRSIIHEHKLRPVKEAFETFETMKILCSILQTNMLHLQIPKSLKLDASSLKTFRDFFSSTNLGSLRIVLEIRGRDVFRLPQQLLNTMQEHGMVHCVDLSKGEVPAFDSDILYTRLFGKGRHNIYQPTDGELAEIDHKASSGKSQKVVMSFHYVRMYKDAARLKTYKQTGRFPKVTSSTGLSSLEEILREDARFPTDKQELVKDQGWKLLDLTAEERVHARDLLEKLPEGEYGSVDEIREKLQHVMR